MLEAYSMLVCRFSSFTLFLSGFSSFDQLSTNIDVSLQIIILALGAVIIDKAGRRPLLMVGTR